MTIPKPYARWTWANCKEKISTLPGRLGFPENDVLRFLALEMNLTDGSITDTITDQRIEPPPDHLCWLLYRYAEAKEVPLTGRLIGFRHVSGGRAYSSVFEGRVVARVARRLGNQPTKFARAAVALGGQAGSQGDVAYTLTPLPLVPLTYILWRGDEEFLARAQVLFDASVEHYLDAEAITHLAALTTERLLIVASQR